MSEDKKNSTGPGAKATKPEPTVEAAKASPAVAEPEPELPTSETFEETPTLRAIHKWVSKRVHGSPISRNTEAFNYLMKRLPELASMIDEENKA